MNSKSRSKAGQEPVQDRTIVGYPTAYSEALVIAEKAPGTVCVVLQHYYRPGGGKPRHEQPYRQGYVHYYRMPVEHWHRTLRELEGCGQ